MFLFTECSSGHSHIDAAESGKDMIMTLTSKQRAYLMSLAGGLDPLIQIGKGGVTPEAVVSASDVFNTHELIKGTVLKTAAEDPSEAAQMLAERTRSTLVKVIGRKFILYKPFRDNPRIELPR